MQPADIVAIILTLAALIGCVNHLWIKGLTMPRLLRKLYDTEKAAPPTAL